MRLVVGLGNPGTQYAHHRHNVGFMLADQIARRFQFGSARSRFQSEALEGRIGGHKVLILKPQTYMNKSGQAVVAATQFFKLAPEDVFVAHDELDLPPGKMRIKTGGGHGGHNGLRSLDAHIGQNYTRLRIGIGHPGHKDRVTTHVLGNFAKIDQDWLEPLLEDMAAELHVLLDGDNTGYQNQIMRDRPETAKVAAEKSLAYVTGVGDVSS